MKIRRGPPDDGDGPMAQLEVWAGEIPLRTVRLDPVADPGLRAGIGVPDHLAAGAAGAGRRQPWRELGERLIGASGAVAGQRGAGRAGPTVIPWASATGS